MLATIRAGGLLLGGRALSSGKPSTFYHKDLIVETSRTKRELPKDLDFGKVAADHMLEMHWSAEKGWEKPKLMPFHDFVLNPMNSTLHYAFEGFEGLKAYRDPKGMIRLFRPLLNAERMVSTSQEMCFPAFEPAELVKCIDTLLKIDSHWVPEPPSTLYVRPSIMSMTNKLGVLIPTETLLYVISSPSGPYFKKGPKGLKMLVEDQGCRAWYGGSGNKKIGANYVIGIKYVQKAASQGYDNVIWLTGDKVAEMGGCNVFFHWVNKNGQKELVTPELDGTLLPGITRRTILEMTKTDKRFKSYEGTVKIQDLLLASKEKRLIEMFLSGTAAVIAPVGSMTYKGEEIRAQYPDGVLSSELRKTLTDIQFGIVDHPYSHLIV